MRIPRALATWRAPRAIWSLAANSAVDRRGPRRGSGRTPLAPLADDQSPTAIGPGSSAGLARAPPSQPSRRSRASRHSSGPGEVRDARRPRARRCSRRDAGGVDVVDADRSVNCRLGSALRKIDRRRGRRQLLLEVADVGTHLGRGEDDPLDPVGDEELHDRDDVRHVEAAPAP